jgi:hypothetical protein
MAREKLPKVALGFIIRRCTRELGRQPTALEFSKWANTAGEHGMALFGRPVNEAEAAVILRRQARPVSARSAHAYGGDGREDTAGPRQASPDVRDKVVDFSAVRARRRRRSD